MMFRILLVVTNLAGGGAEGAMLRYATALNASGHDTTVLILNDSISHEVPFGVSVEILRHGRFRGSWLARWHLAWALRRRVKRLEALSGRYDAVISTLPFADEVCRKARLEPLLFRIANTLSAEVERISGSSKRKAHRRFGRYIKLYRHSPLICVSEGVRLDMINNFGCPPHMVRHIYNPFDFERVRTLATEPCTILPSSPYILFSGRFNHQKRIDILLDSYKASGLAHKLVMLTPSTPKLHAMIAERGLAACVEVLGFLDNPFPVVASADLLVLSSDWEGLPNTLVEALVLGVSVVSTDCPYGPREVLTGRLAERLVPRGNVGALAKAMRRFVSVSPVGDWTDSEKFNTHHFADILTQTLNALGIGLDTTGR